MFVVAVPAPGRKPPLPGVVIYAGVRSVWERVRIGSDTGIVFAAYFPDASPAAEKIRVIAGQIKGRQVYTDAQITRVDGPGSTPDPSHELLTKPLLDHVVYLRQAATGLGWTGDDLAGTAVGGDPGERGGRSARTGLTLGDMSLARPPRDWSELASKNRPPWESHDWSPPAPSWRPPSWPDNAVPPTATVAPASPEDTAVPPATHPTDEPQEAAPDADTDDGPGEPAAADSVTSSDGDELAGYPPEHAVQAAEIVKAVIAKKGGAIPHPNAVNYFLRKAEIPVVSAPQLAALYAWTPPVF